jgi:hypothetical protein
MVSQGWSFLGIPDARTVVSGPHSQDRSSIAASQNGTCILFILGVSAHIREQNAHARPETVNKVLDVGPVYASTTLDAGPDVE